VKNEGISEPFTPKSRAEYMDGQWPLDRHSAWTTLSELKDIWDIWAIPGNSPGEINVYTADGDRIHGYVYNHKKERHLVHWWSTDTADGYKVGAVRVVDKPRTLPGQDPKILGNVQWAMYGLCEVSDGKSVIGEKGDHFEIQCFFGPDQGKRNIISPSWENDARKYPVGIAVDSVRLWVFGTWYIVCATHAEVKQCIQDKKTSPPWRSYPMSPDIGGYDPRSQVFQGLRDLSACDDGTLTAVFEDKDRARRIITATTRFEKENQIIEGEETNPSSLIGPESRIGGVLNQWVRLEGLHYGACFGRGRRR